MIKYLEILTNWCSIMSKKSNEWYRPTWSRYTVLVVDDDTPSLVLIRDILNLSCKVVPARDGKEAASILATAKLDFILTDIMIPFISGDDLIHYLRSGLYGTLNKSTPAFAITAYAKPEVRTKLLELGFQRCLDKPISIIPLLKDMDNYLK